MVQVDEVLPASSRLVVDKMAKLDPKTTYKAVIVSLPTPRMSVLLDGDAAACDLVRQVINVASPDGKPSLFIREAATGDAPEFRLLARHDQFVITRPNDERPLVSQIDGLNEDGAKRAVARLEHVTRWTQTARLSNPASSIQPSEVKITVLVDGKEASGREIRLEYQLKDDREVEPTFKVSMANNSSRTLYCGLLNLTQRFQVSANLLNAGCVKLEPGQTAWAYQGKPIPASIPQEVWDQGVIEYKDLLKLIICTEEFDARLLEQPRLDLPRAQGRTTGITRGQTRGISRDGTLNRLMQKIQARDLGESEGVIIDDWQATEVSFTTVRPLLTTRIPAQGEPAATLKGGVKLEGHPALMANVRLWSAPLATRDLKVTLPRLLYDDPSVCQPLTFTDNRGDPGLSVLELTEVNDSSAVTSDAPLRITVPLKLQTNEHVVPVAFDGEFFLPLGRVESRSPDETLIALERLPPPVVDSRSLTGAIRIFFQKVISRKVGLDFPYPILGAADVTTEGTVTPIRDTFQVRNRVEKAQRILLLIHGIIGATESMAPSVQLARLADARPLASLYDLVLTFDYENLSTTIEDNARLLKTRLEAVGLAAGHGKAVDIVAHSMGGLVSRWFIEREGGNQIARRLVMLGTPNGGSPWPRVFELGNGGLCSRTEPSHRNPLARLGRRRPRCLDGEPDRGPQRTAPRRRHPLRAESEH